MKIRTRHAVPAIAAVTLVALGAAVAVRHSDHASSAASWPQVAPKQNFDWILSGTVSTAALDATPAGSPKLLDFDSQLATPALVASVKAKGVIPIAYLEVGSWENYRPDASQFPTVALGNNLDGYPSERFLDTRNAQVVALVKARIAAAAAKGFLAVEPDLDDSSANLTSPGVGENGSQGFPISLQQNLAYNHGLADYAHSLGMAWSMKNSGGDSAFVSGELPFSDFAIVEQCRQYGSCGPLSSFITAGKAVIDVEYGSYPTSSFCPQDNAANFDGVRKSVNLTAAPRVACRVVPALPAPTTTAASTSATPTPTATVTPTPSCVATP